MIITRFLAVVGAGALGITFLAGAALAVLMAAQRAKRWWCSRGETADVPEDEDLSADEAWEAIEAALADRKVLDRRFDALVRAQKRLRYRRLLVKIGVLR